MNTASKLKDWIQNQKDSSVSLIAERMLRKYVEPYGHLIGCALNSRERTASATVLLKGEAEPIRIDVQEYELGQLGTKSFVTVKRIQATRPWLTALLQDFVVGRRLDIPDQYASYVRMLF